MEMFHAEQDCVRDIPIRDSVEPLKTWVEFGEAVWLNLRDMVMAHASFCDGIKRLA